MSSLAIGITGGIGSGKSSVAKIISKEGYSVLNADDIAKSLMVNNKSISENIKNTFGNESYIDGKLNRKFLAKEVFNNPKKIKKLNSIVHPPMISFIDDEIQKLEDKNENLIFVEAALIFEAKMDELFDYILLVTADEELRIERTVERDKAERSEVESRIKNQMSEEDKKGISDFTIENNSSLQELKQRTHFILSLLNNLNMD